jgi:isopentenyldiphosphate isomerase
MWDISAAGHIDAGEEPRAGAMRELAEELGVAPEARGGADLQYISTIKQESLLNTGETNREFQDVYIVQADLPISAFAFNDDEVAGVRYVHYKELGRRLAAGDPEILPQPQEYGLLFEFLDKK